MAIETVAVFIKVLSAAKPCLVYSEGCRCHTVCMCQSLQRVTTLLHMFNIRWFSCHCWVLWHIIVFVYILTY